MNPLRPTRLCAAVLALFASACAKSKPASNAAPGFTEVSATPPLAARGGLVQVIARATDPDGDALHYAWSVSGGVTVVSSGDGSAVVRAPDAAGAQGVVTVSVDDGRGGHATASVAIATSQDHAPQIASATATPTPAAPGATLVLAAAASDADDDALAYTWTAPAGWTLGGTVGNTATLLAPSSYGASGVVQVQVDDGQGGTASASILVSTSPDGVPTIDAVSAAPAPAPPGATVELTASASDPDGDALSYAWTLPAGWSAAGPLDGATVTVTAPPAFGASGLVLLTVDDGHGKAASGSAVVSTVADGAPAFATLAADPNPAFPGGTIALTAAALSPVGNPISYAWSVIGSGWTLAATTGDTVVLTAPGAWGSTGAVIVTADDGHGGVAVGSLSVSTVAYAPPTISSLTASPGTVLAGGSVKLAASAASGYGLPLTYAWTASDPAWTLSAADDTAVMVAPSAYSASCDVTLTVSDASGASARRTLTLYTAADRAPTVFGITLSPSPPVRGQPATFSATASDPDGDAFTWAWSITSAPTGSTATLAGADTATPSFTPDLRGYYYVQVVATDSAGARSYPVSTYFSAATATPVASVAGAPQLSAVMNTDLALDGSASSSPSGDPLTYAWSVAARPAGAFATLTPIGSGATATFRANFPGSYTVKLTVTDPWGDAASTSVAIDVAGPAQLVAVSGDGQTGAVNTDLESPVVVRALTTSGAPVPGLVMDWLASGAVARLGTATDGNGYASCVLLLSRLAGPGQLTARVHTAPSLSAPFAFTALAGPVASVAVAVSTGDTDTGAVVSVRPIDAYGNPSTASPGGDAQAFRLVASGSAFFDATPDSGAVLAGGGTSQLDGQLVDGSFDVVLHDPVAQAVSVSIQKSPLGGAYLPFSGWAENIEDNAESGLSPGWTADYTAAPAWRLENGAALAHAGSRSFGLELAPSDLLFTGRSALVHYFGSGTSPMVKLEFWQNVDVTGGVDPATGCTAQPAMYLAGRACTGGGCSSELTIAPRGGYPVATCAGRGSFGSTGGWVAGFADVTDAIAAGYRYLQFAMSNTAGALTPVVADSWRVDDVRILALSGASTQAAATTLIRPGAPALVRWSAPSYGGGVLYNQCMTGTANDNVTAQLVDAQGNVTQESNTVYELAWTGGATVAGAPAGTIVSLAANDAEVQFDQGLAALTLSDPVNESVALSLVDSRGTGLPAGPGAGAVFGPRYCHDNGLGGYWSDGVPPDTHDAVEATRACETRYAPGACANNGSSAYYFATPTYGCGLSYQWTFNDFTATDPCAANAGLVAGTVTGTYWISSCTCTAVEPPGGTTFSAVDLNWWGWH